MMRVGSMCTIRGQAAETTFCASLHKLGFTTTEATERQNKYEHWDVKAADDKSTLYIDVKCEKRLARGDPTTNHGLTWIEVRNQYHRGWLWSPETTHFAFEREVDFLLVRKRDIQRYLKQKPQVRPCTSDMKTYRENPDQFYYRRPNRANERLALVSLAHLAAMPHTRSIPKIDTPPIMEFDLSELL